MKLRRTTRIGIAGAVLMIVFLVTGWSDHGSWVGWASAFGFLIGGALVVADALAPSLRRRS